MSDNLLNKLTQLKLPAMAGEPDTATGNASDLRRTVVRGKADTAG